MNKAKREYIIIEKKNIWDKYETNLRQKIIGHMIHLSCNKSRWRYLKKESRSYKLITVNNLTPDSACRTFFNNNIYFSAFCNAVLFNGKQLIDASNLIHYENDSAVIINDTKKVEDKKRRRDIIVRGDIHGIYCLFGIEHQSTIDQEMVIRCGNYEMMEYLKQIKNGMPL